MDRSGFGGQRPRGEKGFRDQVKEDVDRQAFLDSYTIEREDTRSLMSAAPTSEPYRVTPTRYK